MWCCHDPKLSQSREGRSGDDHAETGRQVCDLDAHDELRIVGVGGKGREMRRPLIFTAAAVLAAACAHLHGRNRLLRTRLADALEAASTDALTGIANRAGLQRAAMAAVRAAAPGELIGVVLVDLDEFKRLNDTCGHAAGDAALVAVAALLADLAPPGACAARLGGDEFAVLTGPLPPAVAAARLEELLARIEHGLAVSAAGVCGSAGGALIPAGGVTRLGQLLEPADVALYGAKGRRRAGQRARLPADWSAAKQWPAVRRRDAAARLSRMQAAVGSGLG